MNQLIKKSSTLMRVSKSSIKPLTTSFIVAALTLLPTTMVSATNLNLDQLGQYNFTFDKVAQVKYVSGSNVLAAVTEKQGENFSVFLPFSVQQVNYMVSNGQTVTKNQPIAYLTGYDVHHFLDEFEAAKQLFENANQQYQSSKRLYNQKALSQSKWVAISQHYFAAKLRFEHLHHYKSFLHIDDNEKISIIAPTSGVLRYALSSTSQPLIAKNEGELLFDVIPTSAIRLKVNVPITNLVNLNYFNLVRQKCKLALDNKEQVINGFTVAVWSKSVVDNSTCQLSLGQNVVVTPIYDQQAYRIKKSAVFEFKNQNYIAIKEPEQNQLTLVAVTLLNSTNEDYIFSSVEPIINQQVLVTSVSAIQGVLLELGGE